MTGIMVRRICGIGVAAAGIAVFGGGCASKRGAGEPEGWRGAWVLERENEVGMIVLGEGGAAANLGGTGAVDQRNGRWVEDAGGVKVDFPHKNPVRLRHRRGSVQWAEIDAESGKTIGGWQPARAAADDERRFVGIWRLNPEPDGRFLQVVLGPGGMAISTIRGQGTGRWSVVDGRAVAVWPDGWRDEIAEERGRFFKRSWAPGANPSDDPVDRWVAVRISPDP